MSASEEAVGVVDVLPTADLYPTWLLPVPQRLVVRQSPSRESIPCYHGELTLLAGPQRLETGWLDGEPALRDYYIARSPHAGLVWVYRERLSAHATVVAHGAAASHITPHALHWFLHGLFA